MAPKKATRQARLTENDEETRKERARLVTMKRCYENVEREAKAQQEWLTKKIEEHDNETTNN